MFGINPMEALKAALAPFLPMLPALKMKHKIVMEHCASPGSLALALEKAEKDILAGAELQHITAEVDGKQIRALILGPKELIQKFSLT